MLQQRFKKRLRRIGQTVDARFAQRSRIHGVLTAQASPFQQRASGLRVIE